ncbi:MAG TPA: tetratricopeptide repeat protein [Bryobacteraceae bacterium]|nr:tetratricopeptide repeat protein [Bryobacteraceae bacterium]
MLSFTLAGFLLLQAAGAEPPAAAGMRALQGQRWAEAVDLFSRAAAAEPKDYGHHFHLAFAQSMLNRDAEAIAAYRKVLELKPGLYEAQVNLGIVLLTSGKPAEAADLLVAAANSRPKEFRPVYHAGEALLASGRASQAIPLFESALAIDPKAAGAILGLARALAREKRVDEASARFREAGESNPEALLELALLFEHSGKRDEAIEIYRKFPDNAAARERLGQLLLEGGKASDAVEHLESAVKDAPTTANRYALAMAYMSAARYSDAENLFKQLVADEPANVQMRANYARSLRQQKKIPQAAAEFLKVTEARPDSAEAWSDVAGMLMLLENYQGALAALDKVRALQAETPAHFYLRALILDRHKVYEQALDSYEKFLAGSQGKSPDEEFKARQRVRIIRKELSRR